ncbi:zinc transporter ZntB [Oleiagrimonas soli]|uniref:Magnesium transporter CorA n=1 Tax=Oleiagrimonas soli TaxID=1543381 RepID=A0A099CYL0_9GAMM|nr:zinc transporter ZntB [Oleiagrimonas soli]KGI78105.1 magnesium transporter CorA [Oleiagrimonas soli]MBB6183461.1 zinc transporter [Oleiagrimonas soli]
MDEQEGLIYAGILDGKGGARRVGWSDVTEWRETDGPLWVHLDHSQPAARRWVLEQSGIDEFAAQALLSEETRPRATNIGDATLVFLRGVNLNPGSQPEDMVSIRIWIEKHRIITLRRRTLLSVTDVLQSFDTHNGPKSASSCLARVIGRMIARMQSVIDDLQDRAAEVEEDVLSDQSGADLRSVLASIRRETITLRRYLSPQREAMTRLYADEHPWIGARERSRLRESADQLQRYLEDLDSVRDRALVTHEELANRLSEQMNARIYLLSLVAALFLPLSFFTGLLGINVGGIPGTDNKAAFAIVVLFLLVVIGLQLAYFKSRKWF